MKDKLIEIGISKGMKAETLEAKYTEFFNTIKAQPNMDDATASAKATMSLKAYIKKIMNTPTERLKCLVLGSSTTDFGKMMKRKHGDIYPETHYKAGQPIPDSELSKKVVLFNFASNCPVTISLNHGDVNKFKIAPGTLIEIMLTKGSKENVYFYDADMADVKELKVYNYDEMKSFFMDNMNSYIVKKLSDLKDMPNYQLSIVIAENIVDIRNAFDNVYLNIDDTELDIDESVEVLVELSEIATFNPSDNNVMFVIEKMKTDKNVTSAKSFGMFAPNPIKAQPIDEDVLEVL